MALSVSNIIYSRLYNPGGCVRMVLGMGRDRPTNKKHGGISVVLRRTASAITIACSDGCVAEPINCSERAEEREEEKGLVVCFP